MPSNAIATLWAFILISRLPAATLVTCWNNRADLKRQSPVIEERWKFSQTIERQQDLSDLFCYRSVNWKKDWPWNKKVLAW